MAAVLIEIKSRMLLPRPVCIGLRRKMIHALSWCVVLLEYEQMKLAAQRLNELPQAERDFSVVAQVWIDQAVIERLPDVSMDNLRNAWLTLMARSQANRHHRITREELSVRAHMSRILRQLQGHNFVEFNELFSPSRRRGGTGGNFSCVAGAGQGKSGGGQLNLSVSESFMSDQSVLLTAV